jgi:protein-L-isoaspartate(D-aspartate) O-methyltransferase
MTLKEDLFRAERQLMVREQIELRGITDERLLDVLRQIPRHLFIPGIRQMLAYADCALPIDFDQTISQPFIVAIMTDNLKLTGGETILEVGTGSGYQAAVLSHLCRQVITLERITPLAEQAARLLADLHCNNVEVHSIDGSLGWPASAPYAGILVTAAAPEVPEPLLQQLSEGGRLIIPVGPPSNQRLQLWRRQGETFDCQDILPVVFVPLRGQLGWKEND